MTKGRFMRIVLILGSVLILIGVALMTWMLITEIDRNNIEVYLSDDKTHTIEFKNLSLVPGESCEYYVKLKSENAKKYDLSLDFVETEDKTLKNFAYVKILSKDKVICDELLSSVFENKNIVLPVDFEAATNTELTIVYYLPIDVGNEAKNAEAVFELLIKASNE